MCADQILGLLRLFSFMKRRTATIRAEPTRNSGADGLSLRNRARIVVRLCYDEQMKKRPGGTVHLSISLPSAEAKILRRRAKRAYGGNVSRVISDAIRYVAYEEGRDALI